MEPTIQDRWSQLVATLDTMTNDRDAASVEQIGPLLDKLMRGLLALAYDRDTTDKQIETVREIMAACYQYGRSNLHLNQILKGR